MPLRLIHCLLLLVVTAFAEPQPQSGDWWSTVVEKDQFTATSHDGVLRLQVKLAEVDGVTEKTVKTPDGEETRFYRNRTRLPESFWPGRKALRQFDFYWNGKRIPIPVRFWRDIYGFRIQTTPNSASKLPETSRYEFEQFLSRLDQPRVSVSADGGTALIEWERPEECDSHSTYRWIITRDGRVLRHRDMAICEC